MPKRTIPESIEFEYLWKHFAFNAEQRLKAFNFYIVLSLFGLGGVATAIEKDASDLIYLLLGIYISLISISFIIIDLRSQELVNIAVPGIKKFEENFSEDSRLFIKDRNNREKKKRHFKSYKLAFRLIYFSHLAIGILVFLYGFTGLTNIYCLMYQL